MNQLRENLRRFTRACLFDPISVWLQECVLGLASRLIGPDAPAASKCGDRIVIVKLDGIGDFVLVTPFLRELRRAYPCAWITLVTTPQVESLARTCPHVNELVVAPHTIPGLGGIIRHWTDWLGIAWRRLRPLSPTLAILPRWDSDIYDAFALLAFTGADRRVSYSSEVSPDKKSRNRQAELLLTDAVRETSHLHEVERNLDLLRFLGLSVKSTSLELRPAADGAALTRTLLGPRAEDTIVALCPFSAEFVKDWPFENFLALVANFSAQPNVTFVLLASAYYAALDTDLRVRALPNLVIVAGRLSLDETAAFLAQCDLVVSVDTGLAHIAAAQRRRLVLISGQSPGHDASSRYSPERFGLWEADCMIVAPPADTPGPRPIIAVEVAAVTAALSARLLLRR
jgi:ADP-heptose:LPS heptosyltransferase